MPGRVDVTFDGTTFAVKDAHVLIHTNKDQAGMAVMGTFDTEIQFVIDLTDDKNFPFASIQKLFNAGNVPTRDKIKDLKIEFWKDDAKKDVVCSYKCKAWISSFKTANVGNENGVRTENHLLLVTATPVINKENYQDLSISN
ncbi:MAG: hypothetical protein J2P41_03485 [Blastocatellia bacterium]|nr:hypothetical protein [Blastocatellia bacterium]